jgi:hypothetical protein
MFQDLTEARRQMLVSRFERQRPMNLMRGAIRLTASVLS